MFSDRDQTQASEAEDLTTAILDTMREGLVVLDEDLSVRTVNAAFCRLFGVGRDDTVGRPLTALGDGQWDTAPLTRALENLARVGEAEHELEVSAVFPGLGQRTMRLRARRLNGTATRDQSAIALVIEDVTELREVEAALAALHSELKVDAKRGTTELAAANEELEAFAYSVSHDLRAPLRALSGFSEALAEDYGDRLDARGHEYLQHIQTAADVMSQLINHMLRLSRLTRSEMSYERVDLSALVRRTLDELAFQEPARRVSSEVEEDLFAEGDPVLLRTAIQNLIENAWKYTRYAPEARIEFRSERTDNETAYVVSDNGAGFDMAYAGKLFAPFERLHGVHEFEGTGVGLATVNRIIHRHGGLLRGEGAVGHGATFTFTLGRRADDRQPSVQADSA
ncbi:MAG TPA: ATP-binding protein [Rubricoccaceae bacterium]|jgi:PAS domain S-box-containing protein